MAGKLTRGSISIGEFYRLSKKLFDSKAVDDKDFRARVDVKSSKVVALKNFEYNKVTKAWEDTQKRSVKFEFLVSTVPTSYKRTDKLKKHYYPVTFLIYSIEDGLDSTFKYRSGSLKKPLFAKKGATPEQRNKIAEQNIRNGVDLWFFYNLEFLLSSNGLLFNVNRATRAPSKTNPKGYVYFEKHSLWVFQHVLIYILRNPQAIEKLVGKLFKSKKA
jgi:hypothetical protein